MGYCSVDTVAVVLLWTLAGYGMASKPGVEGEYCETEVFKAVCDADEVIVMTAARYGRMKLGHCVKKDLGYIGCSTDVLHLADKKCSGRRTCEIRIPDPTLDSTKPCLEELKTYLEAAYTCVKVHTPANSCLEPGGNPLTAPQGFLSSLVTLETLCGSETTPWVIKGQPGQLVNVTFYDFNLATRDRHLPYHMDSPSITECEDYAYLLDPSARRKMKICAGRQRVTPIYVSHNHTLEVALRTRAVVEKGLHFLLHYQIVGCPDLRLPDDMYYRPLGPQDGIVGCLNAHQTWPVTCRDNEWTGAWGNCTTADGITKPRAEAEKPGFRHELSIVIVGITCIVLVMVCAVVGIGGYCIRRVMRRHTPTNSLALHYEEEGAPCFKPPEHGENIINDLTEDDYPKPCPIHQQEQYARVVQGKQNNRRLDGNDYTAVPRGGYETELQLAAAGMGGCIDHHHHDVNSYEHACLTEALMMQSGTRGAGGSAARDYGGSKGSLKALKCSPGKVTKLQCSPNNRKRKNVNNRKQQQRPKSGLEMLHVPKQAPCLHHNTLPNIVILDNVKSNPRTVLYKLMEMNKDVNHSSTLPITRNTRNLNNTI